jgi:transposase
MLPLIKEHITPATLEEALEIIKAKDVHIAELNANLDELCSKLKELGTKTTELSSDNQYLKFELEKIKRLIFGSKSERFVGATDPNQLLLFNLEQPKNTEPSKETITIQRNKPLKQERVVNIRGQLPADLPRITEIIEPKEDITGAKKIGEEITEVMEYTPGKIYVKRYVRPKYALPEDKGIVIGELPSLPIPKGNAGASLLSHILVSKYVDHLPFYRQVQMFKRDGVEIAESTINDWFQSTCALLEPLYQKNVERIRQSNYLMVDETPIPVLDKDHPGSTHRGYHWVYYDPVNKIVCFDYRRGRSREGPLNFLKDFRGTLQTDGYSGYDIFEHKEGITLLSCMAHARRYFDQAKNNDKERSEYVLGEMQKLYEVERIAREDKYSYDQLKEMRVEKSLPIIKDLESWLKDNITQVLPKSAIGVAIGYTMGRWGRLKRYIEDGRYQIDNNLIENSIRPVALGRKNYMFAGSHDAAQCAAMIYSFLGTCKINQINPEDWFNDVLNRISDYKVNRLEELLPTNWKPIINNQSINTVPAPVND